MVSTSNHLTILGVVAACAVGCAARSEEALVSATASISWDSHGLDGACAIDGSEVVTCHGHPRLFDANGGAYGAYRTERLRFEKPIAQVEISAGSGWALGVDGSVWAFGAFGRGAGVRELELGLEYGVAQLGPAWSDSIHPTACESKLILDTRGGLSGECWGDEAMARRSLGGTRDISKIWVSSGVCYSQTDGVLECMRADPANKPALQVPRVEKLVRFADDVWCFLVDGVVECATGSRQVGTTQPRLVVNDVIPDASDLVDIAYVPGWLYVLDRSGVVWRMVLRLVPQGEIASIKASLVGKFGHFPGSQLSWSGSCAVDEGLTLSCFDEAGVPTTVARLASEDSE